MKKLLVALFVIASFTSFAQTSYKYDYKTGNSYNIYKNGDSTTINGYNSKTGNTWRQQNNSNGTYSGTDSKGNYYNGNNKTGSYYNSGTGKSCYGKGSLRICY